MIRTTHVQSNFPWSQRCSAIEVPSIGSLSLASLRRPSMTYLTATPCLGHITCTVRLNPGPAEEAHWFGCTGNGPAILIYSAWQGLGGGGGNCHTFKGNNSVNIVSPSEKRYTLFGKNDPGGNKFFPYRTETFSEGFDPQQSKQKVTKIVSLDGNGEKSTVYPASLR